MLIIKRPKTCLIIMRHASTRQMLENVKLREQKLLKMSQNLNAAKLVNVPRNSHKKTSTSSKLQQEISPIPKQEIQRLTISNAIISYVRVCNELKDDSIDSFFDLAWKKYSWYRSKFIDRYGNEAKFGDQHLYHKMLTLIAEKGHLEHLDTIWSHLRKDGIAPKMQHFAQTFKFAGKNNIEIDDRIKYQFELSKIDAKHLLIQSSKEKSVDYQFIENGLKITFPHLDLSLQNDDKHKLLYLSPLVQHLNERNDTKLKSPSNLIGDINSR